MANMTVSSGQTLNNATISGGNTLTVLSGGSVGTISVSSSGSVTISSGGFADDTFVSAGGVLTLAAGAGTSNTFVDPGGAEYNQGGTELATDVENGGTWIETAGVAAGPFFEAGSHDVFAGGSITGSGSFPGQGTNVVSGAVLSATVASQPGGSSTQLGGTFLQAGGSLDLTNVIFATGATASFNSATSMLTIAEGGITTQLLLGAGNTNRFFTIADDGKPNIVTGVNGTIVTDYNAFSPSSTVDASISQAQQLASYARYDVSVASTVALLAPGVFQTITALVSVNDGTAHTLSPSFARELIIAGGGADAVMANGDTIVTGEGQNTVDLVSGTNTLYSEGSDTVFVGAGSDTVTISGRTAIVGGTAALTVFLQPNAALSLTTGTGSVSVYGGLGSGSFSGGTNGHNLLVGGTGPTTLYAGGAGDVLESSGGSSTNFYGYGGAETMTGQFSQGTNVFTFDGANVFAVGGSGHNYFNIGSGNNAIVAGTGTAAFNVNNGSAGGTTFVAGFDVTKDQFTLNGYANDEVSHALGTATVFQGSETLHLRDGTTLSFLGVTGLTTASITAPAPDIP